MGIQPPAYGAAVKEEVDDGAPPVVYCRPPAQRGPKVVLVISDSDSDADEGGAKAVGEKRPVGVAAAGGGGAPKRPKPSGVVLPPGFLDPLPRRENAPARAPAKAQSHAAVVGFKQFWKAGDYYDQTGGASSAVPARSLGPGMDHVRVHPKFLHSNATSHKWALGALAELLDNSLDEVSNGATYVNIDMLENRKDGTRMLLVEDDGGGMDPDKMRKCMSLGYSVKSKDASTIGQYGNGFKTSTMRIGADAIVFSRSSGKDGRRSTQSIGLLSYTFLREKRHEDIIVPMVDFEEIQQKTWGMKLRTTLADWSINLDTIVEWSPYFSQDDLLQQFNSMGQQGTRIVIYNLWEDDQGDLELDFDTDKYDIQIRGVNRDEKNIQMARQYPNSKHFLTFRHSLRSYASILYLRLPHTFRMILRGKEIEHHNIVNDMMLKQEVTYRPQAPEGVPKDPNMIAVVTVGFVKDAKHHIDVQGFNVYHKNRLIKPFWRVWTAAGSGGRGVIGVLEANFIEPAHDKQDFERTTILSRLEVRLIQMQKNYWNVNSHKIGYNGNRSANAGEMENGDIYANTAQKTSAYSPRKCVYKSKDPSMKFTHVASKSACRYPRTRLSEISDTSDEAVSEFEKRSSKTPMQSRAQVSAQNGINNTAPHSLIRTVPAIGSQNAENGISRNSKASMVYDPTMNGLNHTASHSSSAACPPVGNQSSDRLQASAGYDLMRNRMNNMASSHLQTAEGPGDQNSGNQNSKSLKLAATPVTTKGFNGAASVSPTTPANFFDTPTAEALISFDAQVSTRNQMNHTDPSPSETVPVFEDQNSRTLKEATGQVSFHGICYTPASSGKGTNGSMITRLQPKDIQEVSAFGNQNLAIVTSSDPSVEKLNNQILSLKERILEMTGCRESLSKELELERGKNESLASKLKETEEKLVEVIKEKEAMIEIFREERARRDQEELNLRKKLKESATTIDDLLAKLLATRSGKEPLQQQQR